MQLSNCKTNERLGHYEETPFSYTYKPLDYTICSINLKYSTMICLLKATSNILKKKKKKKKFI